MILDELLWIEDLCFGGKELWPAVLATCKQLNAEGGSILYSNTLSWTIDSKRNVPVLDCATGDLDYWDFLDASPAPKISSLLSRIAKILIVIVWEPYNDRDDLES